MKKKQEQRKYKEQSEVQRKCQIPAVKSIGKLNSVVKTNHISSPTISVLSSDIQLIYNCLDNFKHSNSAWSKQKTDTPLQLCSTSDLPYTKKEQLSTSGQAKNLNVVLDSFSPTPHIKSISKSIRLLQNISRVQPILTTSTDTTPVRSPSTA